MLSLVPWLALQARAFAPTEDVFVGIEPHRVQHAHPEVQAHLLRGAAWRAFAAGDGQGWQARFDEATGTPRWLWGRGIPMDTGSSDALAADLERLLARHAALLGFEPGTLSLRSANFNAAFDTWYVDFAVLRDPTAPTYRAGISARVKHGNLVLLVVGTAPDAPVTGAWTLDPDAAIEAAVALGPAPDAAHTEPDAVRQLLEREVAGGLELRRTWMVHTRTKDPPGIWVTFVDAETGELLSVHNEVRFATGTVTALHHERTVDGSPLVTSPLPLAVVETTADAATTDDLGDYTITDAATYTTDLHGEYLDLDNQNGPDGQIASASPDITWTDDEATQAEIDSYVFLHQVRDWALGVAPDVEMSTFDLVSNVNIDSVCNAYFDGNVNFFQSGGGCNNTGQIADVNYHEWGHGFHYYSIESGFFDGSLSEGASDCVAFFLTGDSRIAPFFGTGGWAIRDVAPDQVYPDDYVNSYYYTHSNGLIFGGAIWDLWALLQEDLGDAAGTDATEQIFAGLLKGGTDIPGTYWEALVADDDNGNLGDGTPHYCQINEAFGQHGLGAFEGGLAFAPVHEPLLSVAPEVPVTLVFEVLGGAAECVDTSPVSATLHYRVNDRDWKTVEATVAAATIEAELPPTNFGQFVEYWLEGVDDAGNAFQSPYSGEFAPFSTFVGDTIEILCEDFEQDDGDYEHSLLHGDPEAEGADDWMWGTPNGASGVDPIAASSGTNVWGNDLALEDNYNGLYQADRVNELVSPRYDTLHYTDVFLSYRRWLNVEDGSEDQGVVLVDGDDVWSNHEGGGGEHHEDRQWMLHAVDLEGRADQQKIKLAWQIRSDGSGEFGGWTLDDVCLIAPASPDNRLAIVDFEAWDAGGPIGLSWTNPGHLPVERVVVTRRADAWPTAFDDGEIVVDLADPDPGARVETGHLNLDGSAGQYAVYASDGVDWLSWTIEGWNAAHVDANDGIPGADFLPTAGEGPLLVSGQGACGCASGAGPAAGLALLPVLLLRRRR